MTADPIECEAFAIRVASEGCAASVSWRPDIPIMDGAFELVEAGTYDVQGTLDGNSASGEATFTVGGSDCTFQWEASPSM